MFKYRRYYIGISIAAFITVIACMVIAVLLLTRGSDDSETMQFDAVDEITTERVADTTEAVITKDEADVTGSTTHENAEAETTVTAESTTTATTVMAESTSTITSTSIAATEESTAPKRAPELHNWPDSGYNAARISIKYNSDHYSWSSEYIDPGIINYLHNMLTYETIVNTEIGDVRDKSFTEYQIELYNDTGGYSCMLYHDLDNEKAYVEKDSGVFELYVDFARNVDCFLRDVNKGFYGKTVAAELFRQYGWTLGYDIAAWPEYIADISCILPSFDVLSDFDSNDYYFAYNNELSKDAGLDMSRYAGAEVSVRLYRILEYMPREYYPIESCRGVVVWKDDEIIGAYVSAGRHDAFGACSLNGKSFEAASGQTVAGWLAAIVNTGDDEARIAAMPPEQIIEEYFSALDAGDLKSAARCVSRQTLIKSLTTNMPDSELYLDALIDLPLSSIGNIESAKIIDNGITPIDNYRAPDGQSEGVQPGDDQAETGGGQKIGAERQFRVVVDLQYREMISISNGEQFWDCLMVYESPQTGWKIVSFGH